MRSPAQEYNAKVLVICSPPLPLDDHPAGRNGGLLSALSAPCSFALYPAQRTSACMTELNHSRVLYTALAASQREICLP
jgi:hypothetical protein